MTPSDLTPRRTPLMQRVHRVLCLTAIAGSAACDHADAPTAPAFGDHRAGRFLATGFDLEQVVTALASSCGLDRAGQAFCWGSDAEGQLGNGAAGASLRPTPVEGDITFVALAAADYTICGIARGGQVFCWGDGTGGELGNGTLGVPAPAPVPVSAAVQFTAITGGGGVTHGTGHFCALDKHGQLYCWGINRFGQFGDGTAESRTAPTLAPGLTFAMITAGGHHSCGLTRDGTALCAGLNLLGALGDASIETSPVFVPVYGGHTFVSLSAGQLYTCGITTAGQALCWGDNLFGQLGTGLPDVYLDRPTPVASSSAFASIAAGGRHTCATAVRGETYCWGTNELGHLGDGTVEPRLTPTPVAGGFAFQSMDLGFQHSCGITKSLGTWCWGHDLEGRLGTGAVGGYTSPAPVSTP